MVEKEVFKGHTYIQLNTIVNEEVNCYQLTLSNLGESKGLAQSSPLSGKCVSQK